MRQNGQNPADPAHEERFEKLMTSLASVWHDKLDVVSRLLTAGIDVSHTDDKGRTPLQLLTENYTGHQYDLDVAKLLMEKGAKINARLENGSTVLHTAVQSWLRSNKPGMVMLLLQSGADINMQDDAGKTAFDLALEKRTGAAEKKSLTEFFDTYSSLRQEQAVQARKDARQPGIAAHREKLLSDKAKRAPRLGRKP